MDRTNVTTPASILKDIFSEIKNDDIQLERETNLLRVRRNEKPSEIKINENFKISGLKPETK